LDADLGNGTCVADARFRRKSTSDRTTENTTVYSILYGFGKDK
jgi:hypothetical protein